MKNSILLGYNLMYRNINYVSLLKQTEIDNYCCCIIIIDLLKFGSVF